MTKKIIKQLVMASYKKGNLDEKMVSEIAKKLNRTQLKRYIKGLKDFENKNSVTITLAKNPTQQEKRQLETLYPNKKILYNIDESLILGMRIENYDNVYEMNLQNTLSSLLSHIGGNNQ